MSWSRACLGSLMIGVMGPPLAGCGPWQPTETASLSAVVRNAQTAELNIDALPAGYHGPPGSPSQIQPALDRVASELGKYYAGSLLKSKVSDHQTAIRSLAQGGGGSRIGGVSALELQDVSVSGQSATVKARVSVWFKTAQFWYRPVAKEPTATNVMDVADHLVRIDGTWKIDQEQLRFAPSGGP